MSDFKVGEEVLYDGEKATILFIANEEDFMGDKYLLETYDEFGNVFYQNAGKHEIEKAKGELNANNN